MTDRDRFNTQMHYQPIDRTFHMEFGQWAENFIERSLQPPFLPVFRGFRRRKNENKRQEYHERFLKFPFSPWQPAPLWYNNLTAFSKALQRKALDA